MDENKYLITKGDRTATNVEGVFAWRWLAEKGL